MIESNYQFTQYTEESWDIPRLNYLESFDGGYFTVKDSYKVPELSLYDFALHIQDYLSDTYGQPTIVKGISNGTIILEGKDKAIPIFITLNRYITRADHKGERAIDVEVASKFNIASELVAHLDKKVKSKQPATIHWWFTTKNENTSIRLSLKNKYKMYKEFYPWIDEDPTVYFKRFIDADAPLLFLSGAPGSGKTSFLRYMICKYKMETYVGYDAKVFDNDELFTNFLTSTSINLLVMEDAESLVVPRDKGGNNMMSRFLNVSDGLINFPNKKIIFTTNESSFENIDSALVRPGRCFDFLEFRRLTCDEAEIAAKAAGIEFNGTTDTSLAELFNPQTTVKKRARFGFIQE